jgi:hypothetical protein
MLGIAIFTTLNRSRHFPIHEELTKHTEQEQLSRQKSVLLCVSGVVVGVIMKGILFYCGWPQTAGVIRWTTCDVVWL